MANCDLMGFLTSPSKNEAGFHRLANRKIGQKTIQHWWVFMMENQQKTLGFNWIEL
jgi:hypothetical protein